MKSISIIFIFFILAFNHSASADSNPLITKIKGVESRLKATIGVSVRTPSKDEYYHYKGDHRFPLMSTFKTLACAKLLLGIEKGINKFETSTLIQKEYLITWSPITETMVGQPLSLKEACVATLQMSDNTAANIVLKAIGGPSSLTEFLRDVGDTVTRLDRYEPFLNEAQKGDPRDTTTPNAITKTLEQLILGDILSARSREQLKNWMAESKTSDSLLRSVLPKGWDIADRSGAGGFGSRGITAIVWPEEQAPLIIAIYITQTQASFKDRNEAIAEIGRYIFELY